MFSKLVRNCLARVACVLVRLPGAHRPAGRHAVEQRHRWVKHGMKLAKLVPSTSRREAVQRSIAATMLEAREKKTRQQYV